jgi:hypothetical protein
MGMQLHFNSSDLPTEATFAPQTDDWWEIRCYGTHISVNTLDCGESFWFDIGQARASQMDRIKTLIEWRVCFTCS